jgi:predicted ferric reductase
MIGPRKSMVYWVGLACILIGVVTGILIILGTVPLTKPAEAWVTAFAVLGAILVLISYSRVRKP